MSEKDTSPQDRRNDAELKSYRQLRADDDRSYYLVPKSDFVSRKETHYRKRPWYNQRWVMAVVLLIGFAGIWLALSGVNESIQQQTESLQQAVADVTDALKIGFDRIVFEIRTAVGTQEGG